MVRKIRDPSVMSNTHKGAFLLMGKIMPCHGRIVKVDAKTFQFPNGPWMPRSPIITHIIPTLSAANTQGTYVALYLPRRSQAWHPADSHLDPFVR
jgi:hypothetical protein